MEIAMTPALSVTRFQPQFGDFLYATVGEGGGETLSVLSALARLGVNPWDEAAELSELSLAAAISRLTSLLARLPKSNEGAGASIANVARLLKLLPHRDKPNMAPGQPPQIQRPAQPKALRVPIFATLVVCVVIVLSFLVMRGGDRVVPAGGENHGFPAPR
jgi:hypothetical protein